METGQTVSHYIITGGRYAKAYAKLAARGFQLHWQSAPESGEDRAKKASKTKFTCPTCGQNAWAKPEAMLVCGKCMAPMEAQDTSDVPTSPPSVRRETMTV